MFIPLCSFRKNRSVALAMVGNETERDATEEAELGPRRDSKHRVDAELHELALERLEARIERDVSELGLRRHTERDETLSAETEIGKDADAGKGPHAISRKADLEVVCERDPDTEIHRRDGADRAEWLVGALGVLRPAANDRVEGSPHHAPGHRQVPVRIPGIVALGRARLEGANWGRLALFDPVGVLGGTLLVLGRGRIGPLWIGLRAGRLCGLGLGLGHRLRLGRRRWRLWLGRRRDRRTPSPRLRKGEGREREHREADA
jgi:hypothetical protein